VKKPKKKLDSDKAQSDERAYMETLAAMRRVIHFTAVSKVEDIQRVTTAWVPHSPSCFIKEVSIPETFYAVAAKHICENLGEENLERVGRTWWQWRRPGSTVRAEWVEMKSDYAERMKAGGESKKVMFYVHGGAYFFGGIGHGPQIQRHARK
jgi:acetyl esterase/lipase